MGSLTLTAIILQSVQRDIVAAEDLEHIYVVNYNGKIAITDSAFFSFFRFSMMLAQAAVEHFKFLRRFPYLFKVYIPKLYAVFYVMFQLQILHVFRSFS